MLTTLTFFLTLLVSTSASYALLSRLSNAGRSSAEYVKLVAIVLGFNISIAGIGQGLQLISAPLGTLFILVAMIPLIAYLVRCAPAILGALDRQGLLVLGTSLILGRSGRDCFHLPLRYGL